MRINSRSNTPIYRQIAESVDDQITSGAIRPGDRLPSARSLAETLRINMHTVLKAYSTLESEGTVEMRRGRGGVVVTEAGDIGSRIEKVVSAAKRSKLALPEVQRLIEESWK